MSIVHQFVCTVPALPKKPQKLHLTVSLLHDAHAAVGCAISTDRGQRVHCSSHAFIADTGAQTCVADTSILSKLNITSSDLIPTSHCLIAATQSQINIVGVALVEISDGCASTRQMLYICDNIRGAYLSETAQIDLGIIPPDFPHRPTHVTPIYDVSAQPTTKLAPCGCPLRQDPPPLPTALPFPTAGGSTTELQTWILQYYKSSAFNTCEHQQLPAMTSHPMSTHFRPDAQPKAYHTPIPVPHHWKQEVKEALDMDVRLGTIERVPQGTPTIWCSRMVVVPKKNGSPRRTVDLQALNAATYRETHHTPSPFHQASTVPANTLKTTLDAWNGYHSLPLSAAAKKPPPSSPSGVDTGIAGRLRASMLQGTPTHVPTMISRWMCHARSRLLMTPSSGTLTLRRLSTTPSNTLTYAPAMVSYSTPRNSLLPGKPWTLVDLPWPSLASNHPLTSLQPLPISLSQQT